MPEKVPKTWSSIDRTHGAARLAVLSTSVCFTFWGCLPAMSTPPAAPVAADRSHESGLSVARSSEDFGPYHASTYHASIGYRHRFGVTRAGAGKSEVGIHAYGISDLKHTVEIPTTLDPFDSDAPVIETFVVPGAGVYFRRYFVSNERVHVGAEIGGGWIYGEMAIPMAFAVHDRILLTAKPSKLIHIGYRVPVGFSIKLDDGRIDVEGGANADRFGSTTDWYPFIGVGISRTW